MRPRGEIRMLRFFREMIEYERRQPTRRSMRDRHRAHTSRPTDSTVAHRPIVPSLVKDRFDVYRFFNGLAAESSERSDMGRARIPVVKSFLLEHVSPCSGRVPQPPAEIFRQLGADVQSIDETFFGIGVWQEIDGKPTLARKGYLEQFDERFFAYYTAEKSEFAQRQVKRWIARSADLDATWFSPPLLHFLWNQDVSRRGDDRFGKLSFRHDSVFDMPSDLPDAIFDDDVEADEEPSAAEVEDSVQPERRRIRSEIKDRIGPIRNVLANLQNAYSPLNALYGLRIPSSSGKGGHDLYQDGRLTNRTESFEDHRNTVRYLYRTYKSVLERTEQSAWFAFDEQVSTHVRTSFQGVPLIVRFGETLSKATFDRWMALAFRKQNVFRLWGEPLRLGPTKVHVYGADRHLWQPIHLEITADRLVAILPQRTCGNTFHRLVANIQRYVCPKIDVWLGKQPFENVLLAANTRSSTLGRLSNDATPVAHP